MEGIPTAMISAVPPVPQMMGVPRLVTGHSVTSLLGDPSLPPDQERALRRRIVLMALQALGEAVDEPTTFEVATATQRDLTTPL